MGFDLGWTSSINCCKKGWGAIMGYLSLDGWFEGSLFWVAVFGNLKGENIFVPAQGCVFACALGLIFMVRAWVPCSIVSLSVVKKAVWLSVHLSVNRVPSLGREEVMLSECRVFLEIISMLS